MDVVNPINLFDVPSLEFNETQNAGRTTPNDGKIEQLSKDFESVLMTKLVDAMKDTVEQWQDEKEDAAGGQVQGLFWYYLAQDMADKGGVGLWKDLYRFFTDMQKTNATTQSLDGSTLLTIDEGL